MSERLASPFIQEVNVWVPESLNEEFPRVDITPLVYDYARVDFEQAFDVRDILLKASKESQLPYNHQFRITQFDGRFNFDESYQECIELDDKAHRDVRKMPGYIYYWRGPYIDAEGYNRSFCVTRSAEEAQEGVRVQGHQEAASQAMRLYSSFRIRKYDAWLAPDFSSPDGLSYVMVKISDSEDK